MGSRWTLLCIAILALAAVVFSGSSPHDFTAGQCELCHDMGSDNTPIASRLATTTCTFCHDDVGRNAYMHPVDVQPRKTTVPPDFPLDQGQRLTCATCHDVHREPRTLFGDRTYFLRRLPRGKPFCDSCHNTGRRTGHGGLLGTAHLQTAATTDFTAKAAAFMGIDPLSKQCISCHDGNFGASVTINTGIWAHANSLLNHDNGSHPIGIDYEAARYRRGRRSDLRPIDEVDKRITFYDGKLGCGSCHDPYGEGKQLVIENRRSALCFACHALDGSKRT